MIEDAVLQIVRPSGVVSLYSRFLPRLTPRIRVSLLFRLRQTVPSMRM